MNSKFTFTRVGVGVLFGFAVIGTARQVLAADAEAEGKTSGRMTTLKPAATSHAEPAGQQERSRIGLGVGFFTESSERREEAFVGGQEFGNNNDEPPELESDSIFNIQAWFLQPLLIRGLRWGADVAWFNKYAVVEAEPENEDEEQIPYVFGHMFQLGLQGEYEIERVASKLSIVFGLRAGGSLLFPSDDLRARIDDLDRQGFDVWESPQLGAYIAPLAGVRWPLSERVAVRADLSVQFSKLWLYDAEGEAGGITSETRASLSTTRTQLLLGLDFGL
jgi:hypothetical protein